MISNVRVDKHGDPLHFQESNDHTCCPCCKKGVMQTVLYFEANAPPPAINQKTKPMTPINNRFRPVRNSACLHGRKQLKPKKQTENQPTKLLKKHIEKKQPAKTPQHQCPAATFFTGKKSPRFFYPHRYLR
ncbi:hypothetical protein [Lunatimonas salinarum]|uniref:hypothetical protein n=1 Tax=Lunatimonas salinarum TaxID=1774590 RepID=UPI001ADFD16A|nr:hypothetical protein [Lunatimonas salinarum]